MKNKKNKEGLTTKVLILLIFIILIFYIPDMWKLIDVNKKLNRVLWEVKAQDNLNKELKGIRGVNYTFVYGTLTSSCNNLRTNNHCPKHVQIKGNEKEQIYLQNSDFIKTNNNSFWKMALEAHNKSKELYIKPQKISFWGFIKNNKTKTIRFRITDYLLTEKNICDEKYFYDSICTFVWEKELKIEEVSEKRDDINVNITKFDVKKTNKTYIKANISGVITGNIRKPKLEVLIFRRRNLLEEKKEVNLIKKNDSYYFKTSIYSKILHRVKIMENITLEESESLTAKENISDGEYEDVEYEDGLKIITFNTKPHLKIMMLLRDEDYFYAYEKFIRNNITENEYR